MGGNIGQRDHEGEESREEKKGELTRGILSSQFTPLCIAHLPGMVGWLRDRHLVFSVLSHPLKSETRIRPSLRIFKIMSKLLRVQGAIVGLN